MIGKNIGMFVIPFLPHYGGTETLVNTLSRELLKNKINVHVLTDSYPGSKKESVENGLHVTRTDFLSFRTIYDKVGREFYEYFISYLSDNKIDIIHSHSIHRANLPLTAIIHSAAMELDIPVILHVHLPVETPEDKMSLKTFNWSHIIPVSSWVARQIYNIGVSAKKIKTIPNFVDTEIFRPDFHNNYHQRDKLIKDLDIDEEKIVILTPSRLMTGDKVDERKNLDTVIHGLSHFSKDKDFVAIITAIEDRYYPRESREAKQKLRELAEVLEVDDKIRIPKKNIPQALVPALYSLSDVVALPSSNEPFGLVYIEGMTSGKPVIGAISGAVPEIISHEVTGLLVEPKSPFALFHALKGLFDDNGRKAKLFGKNGRKLVVRKYSASKRINDFLLLYEKLLKK